MRTALLSLFALALAACRPPADPGPKADPGPEGSQAAASTTALTGGPLQPRIEAPAVEGAVPSTVVFDFAVPLVGDEQVAPWQWTTVPADEVSFSWRPGAGTVLRTEPEHPGRLVWIAPGRLGFHPDEPFRPGIRQRIWLERLQIGEAVHAPAAGERWELGFDTPPFALLPPTLVSIDPQLGPTLELPFTAAVDVATLKSRLAVFADDRPVAFEVSGGSETRKATLAVTGSTFAAGTVLRVEVAAGVRWMGPGPTVEAPASVGTLTLPAAALLHVLHADVAETPTGYTIEVVCNDEGLKGSWSRWWHDRAAGDWREVSRRCQPDAASAANHIHLDPPAPFTVTPATYGFRVQASLSRGPVTVSFDPGLRTLDGGELATAWSSTLFVPARSPRVDFAGRGRYLPRSAWARLPLRHVNAGTVQLTIRHVPRRNLLFWLAGDSEAADDRNSDRLYDTTLQLPSALDEEEQSWLDLRKHLPATEPGLYEVTVRSGASRDVARVAITDLQIVAKQGSVVPGEPYAREVHAWALDGDSLSPLGGVDMQLVRRSGKVLANCRTGGDGGCVLRLTPDPVDPSSPFALVASRGEELTFLAFDELRAEVADSQVHGEPYLNDVPYRLSAWTDRGLYRPGDTVHLAAVVRTGAQVAPPSGLPVTVVGTDARGRVVFQVAKTTNAGGLLSHDHELPPYATTGRYDVRFEIGGRVVHEEAVQVEEFVPERLDAGASFAKPALSGAEPLAVESHARYLFGGSAAGSPVEMRCSLESAPFSPPKNADYHVGPWIGEDNDDGDRTLDLGVVTGELGPDGRTSIPCPSTPELAAFTGVGRLQAQVAIFEAGSGRSTFRTAESHFSPEPFVVGLKTGTARAQPGTAIEIAGLVADLGGSPLSEGGEVEARILRLEGEYGWTFDEDNDEERWTRYLRRVADGQQKVAVSGGRFTVRFTPREAADGFLVQVQRGRAQTELYIPGDGARAWWDDAAAEEGTDQTPRPLRPTQLKVEVPDRVFVGKQATARFQAPWRGRALVSVETHEVVRASWIEVQAGPNEVRFTPPTFVPNLYVSVFLLKDPHLESAEAWLPERALGHASVPVEPTDHRLALTMEVPTEVRPQSDLRIGLRAAGAKGDTFVTVAAVDEGILNLNQFETPDPVADLFPRRALGVSTYETVGWTIVVPTPSGGAVGGDAGALPGRVQAIEPVALWSGLVPFDQDGRATVTLPVPAYQGRLRVMAVAAGPSRSGSAEARVTVRDPLVVMATAPRFLVAGDRFVMPIRLTNGTGRAGEATVRVATESVEIAGLTGVPVTGSPLEVEGPADQRVTLAVDGSGTVFVPMRAARALGAARIVVSARLGAEETIQRLVVPFRPGGPRERIVTRVPLDVGEADLLAHLQGWVPMSERTTVWVTANPYGEAFQHLRDLVRYPYGCIEQTTSSTRPLLYARSILEQVDPEFASRGLDTMVAAGLKRIQSMQTASGGFAYWPGGTEPDAWGTTYATHLLLEAKELGFAVEPTGVDRALSWLEAAVQRSEAAESHAQAYALYVLAVGGKGQKALAERALLQLPSPRVGVVREDEVLLQAALWLAGDRRHETALRNPSVEVPRDTRSNDRRYWSALRTRALELHVHAQLFGVDAAAEPLAAVIASALQGRKGLYTTQEIAWSVAALGKRITGAALDYSPPQLVANGQPLRPQRGADGKQERSWAVARASELTTLKLSLSEKGAGQLFALLASEGARVNPSWSVGGEGLRVRRIYRDSGGQVLPAGSRVQLGQTISVQLTVENKGTGDIANVALVDRIAGGWEIENPRLGRDGSVPGINPEELWGLDHLEVRDDRIEAFGTVPPGVRHLHYAVRAVAAGTFTIPPVEAEAMYEPRIWARETGGIAFVDAAFGEGVGAQ